MSFGKAAHALMAYRFTAAFLVVLMLLNGHRHYLS
jgi:hypothetical protein